MAGQLLLLNPRKRRAAPKKRRSTAKRRASYKRNPLRVAAPTKRRSRRRSNPIRARRYRRNPISFKGLGGASILDTLQNALIGGGGAIGVDLIMGQIGKFWTGAPIKVSATGGPNPMYYALKAGVALAVPMLLGKVVGKSLANKLAAGALTVSAYEVARGFIPVSAAMPLGYYNAAQNARRGVGAYTGLRGMPKGVTGGSDPKIAGYLKSLAGRSGSNAAEREGYQVY